MPEALFQVAGGGVRRSRGLRPGFEDVVPVVEGRTEAVDGRMACDHCLGHGVAGGIGVEAAIDRASLIQQRRQPARVGARAGGGQAVVFRMERKATDGVDG